MNQILRFSDYDVFAYLTSGLAALAVFDLFFSTHYVIAADWSVADGFLIIAASYVVGQLLASPAQWLIERRSVRFGLGLASDLLIRTTPLCGWRWLLSRSVLGEYYRPLNPVVGDRLRRFIRDSNLDGGDALFWVAYPAVKKDPIAFSRIEGFLRL